MEYYFIKIKIMLDFFPIVGVGPTVTNSDRDVMTSLIHAVILFYIPSRSYMDGHDLFELMVVFVVILRQFKTRYHQYIVSPFVSPVQFNKFS